MEEPVLFNKTAGVIRDYKKNIKITYNIEPMEDAVEEEGFYLKEIAFKDKQLAIDSIKQIRAL